MRSRAPTTAPSGVHVPSVASHQGNVAVDAPADRRPARRAYPKHGHHRAQVHVSCPSRPGIRHDSRAVEHIGSSASAPPATHRGAQRRLLRPGWLAIDCHTVFLMQCRYLWLCPILEACLKGPEPGLSPHERFVALAYLPAVLVAHEDGGPNTLDVLAHTGGIRRSPAKSGSENRRTAPTPTRVAPLFYVYDGDTRDRDPAREDLGRQP
jgi:hypothetical protein